MSPVGDVIVLDGGWSNDGPCVVMDAEFARKALESGELPLFVHQALESLELSGKQVAVLSEQVEP